MIKKIPTVTVPEQDALEILKTMGHKPVLMEYFWDGIDVIGVMVTFEDGGKAVIIYADRMRKIR